MFNFFKNTLTNIYQTFTNPFSVFFTQKNIDQQQLKELETLLIKSDAGIKTTKKVIQKLEEYRHNSSLSGQQAEIIIKQELLNILQNTPTHIWSDAKIFLMIGINGSGKTTFCAKLAHYFQQQKKTTMLVAADTFRAAASNQLQTWANTTNSLFIASKPNQDPASVIFDACSQATQQNLDTIIIDTAGRLENKEHLMLELGKIKRIIEKKFPNQKICTLLTIDAMLGQNSFDQARTFHAATIVDGIVLTKMDSTAKGGIVFHIVQELQIPIAFISWGEQLDQIQSFNAQAFIEHLFEQKNIIS